MIIKKPEQIMASFLKKHASFIFFCLSSLLAAILVFFLAEQKAFRLIELKMLDYRFQLRGRTNISKDIILVSIGGKDIELLGRWPWPRKYHADLIQILAGCGVKAIGYDILFSRPDPNDPDSDSCLSAAVKEAGNVCFAMAFSNQESRSDILPIPSLIEASAGVGYVNVYPDEDGLVRRMPLVSNGKSALGINLISRYLGLKKDEISITNGRSLALRPSTGEPISLPVDSRNRMIINYGGKSEDWQWLHFCQIIMAFMESRSGQEPCVDLSMLKGKIVLVGSTQTGLPDVIETPFGTAYGIELHASIINSILERNFIRSLPGWIDRLLYLAIVLSGIFVFVRLRPLTGGLFSGGFLILFIVGTYLLFSNFHLWIKVVKPVMGLAAVYIMGIIYHFLTVEQKEKMVRRAFAHYVSPKVVAKLIREPEKLKLGGEIKDLTILFSDIRGFTTFSETLEPGILGEMLNEYFSFMTQSIFNHGGTLDKFIGDAIMAIYGAPVDQVDHALQGCRTALAMMENLKKLNANWENKGKAPLKIGIGLHSGEVKVGNFGSKERFDYTVIGANVNLASRLEGLTKTYGVDIIISESTATLTQEKILCRPLDRVAVKGSNKPIGIYELVGLKKNCPDLMADKINEFRNGLNLYYQKSWDEAADVFDRLSTRFPDDRPAQIMLERARAFKENPPPENWNGVFVHTTK